MAEQDRDRPCIHVCLTGGADSRLYRWVEIGAEEEGLPCRQVQISETGPVATAYATAQSSRFDIGVAVTPEQVILHEIHMPPEQPVLTFQTKDNASHMCRLMGSNAARLVIRLPFRFADDETEQPFEPPARKTPQPEPPATQENRPARQVEPNPANRSASSNPNRAEIAALVGRVMARQKSPEPGDAEIKSIARIIARILRERGM